MLVIKDNLSIQPKYDLSKFSPLEEILFFDIETTGLSPTNSSLYLIGCVFYKDNSFKYIQWFVDDFSSEVTVLKSFFEFQKGFNTLIHFNGNRFDIPYLESCCEQYGLSYSFTCHNNIDIYKEISPYKKLLDMKSMRQVAIEDFLGISRIDEYNGGELIPIYKQYIQNKNDELLKLLLLHNADDLKGMLEIIEILNYKDFFNGNFEVINSEIKSDNFAGITFINISVKMNMSLPRPLEKVKDYSSYLKPYITPQSNNKDSSKSDDFLDNNNSDKNSSLKNNCYSDDSLHRISINDSDNYNENLSLNEFSISSFISSLYVKDNEITVSIPAYYGEFKYFFAEYKEYYYLTEEDMAVHKKLAEFVDKKFRKKATAATCYTKKLGLFIPILDNDTSIPTFKIDYKSKLKFIEYTDDIFTDKKYLISYILSYFKN